MDYREPEPMPLRVRLGPRAVVAWQTPTDQSTDDILVNDVEMGDATGRMGGVASELIELPAPVEAKPAEPKTADARNEGLDRAIEQTATRLDGWLEAQQKRIAAGLDVMVSQLKERRESELAKLEAWKSAERERSKRELAEDEERFHKRLMTELSAFEEQLALRLEEQEERLAKWWAEAEQLVERRFAELGAPVIEPE